MSKTFVVSVKLEGGGAVYESLHYTLNGGSGDRLFRRTIQQDGEFFKLPVGHYIINTDHSIDDVLSTTERAIEDVTQVRNLGEVAVPREPRQIIAFEIADPEGIRGLHLLRAVEPPPRPEAKKRRKPYTSGNADAAFLKGLGPNMG
jgi:hypothetical protein